MACTHEHLPVCVLLRSTGEVKCGCLSVATTCNRTWLWHPDNDELCFSLLCQCMSLSQVSVHCAFINDRVDLVSTACQQHLKRNILNMVNVELLEVI